MNRKNVRFKLKELYKRYIEIPKDNIIYIETSVKCRTDYVFTTDGEFEIFRYTKYELMRMLDDSRFIVCQRSFIINSTFILSTVFKASIILNDGKDISIGRKYMDFLQY